MYIRDYLNDIPLKALKAIADALDITVEYQARIKLVNAIDMAFWDGTLTARLTEGLSDDHRCVLRIIVFSYNAVIHENTLLLKMEKISGIHRRDVKKLVNDLIPLALVGGFTEEENHYFCPSGIAEQVRQKLIESVVSLPDTSERISLFTPPNLLEDIFSFLARVYKETVPLTLMGRVKKTVLERIFDGSITCRDPLLHFSKESRNSLVIEYLKKRDLVHFDRREARAARKLSGWLTLSMTERIQDFVSFALSHTLKDSATIEALICLLAEMQAGTSFNARELTGFLYSGIMTAGGLKRLESRMNDILSILKQLGLLSFINGRFTLTETGEHLFHCRTLPVDSNTCNYFTVQPNFEIIAGPELEPRVRFMLELLASRKSRDTVLTYVVTQDGVARARERGMSTQDVIQFFDDHSKNPVPQNVRYSIETWANSYGSIFFENVTLMRLRDTASRNSIFHSPETAPFILERLSDNALIVSAEHIPYITASLKRAGFLPEVFGDTVPDIVLSGEQFTPHHISELLEKQSISADQRNFIFPDHLFYDGGTQ